VTISGAPDSTNGPTDFTVTIAFSESVVNFAAADVTVAGGSITGLTGSGAAYSASISTSGVGDTVISIAENVADAALRRSRTQELSTRAGLPYAPRAD